MLLARLWCWNVCLDGQKYFFARKKGCEWSCWGYLFALKNSWWLFKKYSCLILCFSVHSVLFASVQKLLIDGSRTKSHVIKVIEGFETVMFKSKFVEWPPTPDLKLSSEDGRGKVAGYCLHIVSSAWYIYKPNSTHLSIISSCSSPQKSRIRC